MSVDRMFSLARDGEKRKRADQIRVSLQARQAGAKAPRCLACWWKINEGGAAGCRPNRKNYDGVQRQLYIFLSAALVAIAVTSLYLIRSNRQIFRAPSGTLRAASDLAQKSYLHAGIHVAPYLARVARRIRPGADRDGSLLSRVEKQVPQRRTAASRLARSAGDRTIDAQ